MSPIQPGERREVLRNTVARAVPEQPSSPMRLTSTAPHRVAAAALCCGALLGWLACGGGGGGCDGTEPCPPPGDTGELQVVVTTAGPDTDPNGYTVRIGGVADSTVQPNDTLSITSLAPGAHRVQLTDLTADCAVSGTN